MKHFFQFHRDPRGTRERNQREEALELEEHSGSDSPDMRIKRLLLKKVIHTKRKLKLNYS